MNQNLSYDYDVAISYASENGDYVSQVVSSLHNFGLRLFYDKLEEVEVNLWGKDLYEELDDIYRNKALCCVVFLSQDYAKKLWTNHERRSIQARALQERSVYILPVRLDHTEIPGFPPTIAYLEVSAMQPEVLAHKIEEKVRSLGGSQKATPAEKTRSKDQGKSQLALIYLPRWSTTLHARMKDGKDYPLATITSGFERLNNLSGNACALRFDIEPIKTLDWIKIEEVHVVVNAYRPLPPYELVAPLPYEKANVYYVEIDNKPGAIFHADYYVHDGKRDIGFVRIFRGRPETVVIRINARTPGIYNFNVELLISAKNDSTLVAVINNKEFAFDEL